MTVAAPGDRAGRADASRRIVLVLGCRVDAAGRPSPALRRRLAQARQAWQAAAGSLLMVSGGRVGGPVSEAEVMASALRELGVPAAALLMEPRAATTRDNVRFGWALMMGHCGAHLRGGGRCELILVSERFHLPRALRLMATVVAASPWAGQIGLRAEAAADGLRGPARWGRWLAERCACARDLRWLQERLAAGDLNA